MKNFEGKDPFCFFWDHVLPPQKLPLGSTARAHYLWDPPRVTPSVPAQYQLTKRFPSGSSPGTSCPPHTVVCGGQLLDKGCEKIETERRQTDGVSKCINYMVPFDLKNENVELVLCSQITLKH